MYRGLQYAYTVAENNTKMSAALRSTLLMTSIGSSIKDVLTEGEERGVRKLRKNVALPCGQIWNRGGGQKLKLVIF